MVSTVPRDGSKISLKEAPGFKCPAPWVLAALGRLLEVPCRTPCCTSELLQAQLHRCVSFVETFSLSNGFIIKSIWEENGPSPGPSVLQNRVLGNTTRKHLGQPWWYMPAIPALKRLQQGLSRRFQHIKFMPHKQEDLSSNLQCTRKSSCL